jgi:serine/threonine protein kinase
MGYMAPEVIENTGEGKKNYGLKCDLFSFGIIAHMLLLGFNPLKGDSYDETFLKNKACDFDLNKKDILEKYGENGLTFLSRLLARLPQLRYDAY